MIVSVAEGVFKTPDGEKTPVRILSLRSHDGLGIEAALPLDVAAQLAAALDGRQIIAPGKSSLVVPE